MYVQFLHTYQHHPALGNCRKKYMTSKASIRRLYRYDSSQWFFFCWGNSWRSFCVWIWRWPFPFCDDLSPKARMQPMAFPLEFFWFLHLFDIRLTQGWNMSQVTLGAGAAKRSARSWPMDMFYRLVMQMEESQNLLGIPCHVTFQIAKLQSLSPASINHSSLEQQHTPEYKILCQGIGKPTARVVYLVSLQRFSPYSCSPRLNATAANLGSQHILLVDARHVNTRGQ